MSLVIESLTQRPCSPLEASLMAAAVVDSMARHLARREDITYQQARRRILTSNPALAQAVRRDGGGGPRWSGEAVSIRVSR
jgi:hypothetical protein